MRDLTVRESDLLTQGVATNILLYRVAEINFFGESIKTMIKVNFEFLHVQRLKTVKKDLNINRYYPNRKDCGSRTHVT